MLDRRWLWFGGAGLAALVTVSVIVAVVTGGDSEDQPTVHGSLTQVGVGGTTWDICEGGMANYRYPDIHPGAPIQILDSSGEIIGTGSLGAGVYVESNGVTETDGCRYPFEVELDRSSEHYQFVLGTLDPYTFDDPSAVHLVIGASP